MTLLLLMILWGGDANAFQGSFQDALKLAEKEGKYVFVDVYTEWCGPCKLMERTTFKDSEVQALFEKRVVVFKLDAEKGEGPALASKYQVAGYPSLLILDAQGKVVQRKMGYLRANELRSWLEEVLPKS